MTKRKYKTGTHWCLWRWTDVDSEYIVRLHLVKTPWFAVCLHWILKPDPEPFHHDHPVSFLSLVLRGGYIETRQRLRRDWLGWFWDVRRVTNRWYNLVRATPQDRHTIISVRPGTLTLCFMGPKTREWGFHTPDGWVHWKDYYTRQRAQRAGKEKQNP